MFVSDYFRLSFENFLTSTNRTCAIFGSLIGINTPIFNDWQMKHKVCKDFDIIFINNISNFESFKLKTWNAFKGRIVCLNLDQKFYTEMSGTKIFKHASFEGPCWMAL